MIYPPDLKCVPGSERRIFTGKAAVPQLYYRILESVLRAASDLSSQVG